VELGWGSSQQETCDISEMGQDVTKLTIAHALSIGAKINDLG